MDIINEDLMKDINRMWMEYLEELVSKMRSEDDGGEMSKLEIRQLFTSLFFVKMTRLFYIKQFNKMRYIYICVVFVFNIDEFPNFVELFHQFIKLRILGDEVEENEEDLIEKEDEIQEMDDDVMDEMNNQNSITSSREDQKMIDLITLSPIILFHNEVF